MKHKLKITPVSTELFQYLEQHALLPHPVLNEVVEYTARLPDAVMQIPRHQGGFMHLLARLMGARLILEVGCYTGYSAIALASALPDDGELVTCDIDHKTSEVALNFFKQAGLDHKIKLLLAPAINSLQSLVDQEKYRGQFDFVFIDADKVSYESYYELSLSLMRPGGIMLLDNVFRDGEILAPAAKDLGTQALHRLSEAILKDQRVLATMLPIADGLTLIQKK